MKDTTKRFINAPMVSKFLEQNMRYVRHPYLITRAILRPFEERESKKHRLRVNEYGMYLLPLEESLQRITGVDVDYVEEVRAELYRKTKFNGKINEARRFLGASAYGVSEGAGDLLYVLCRIFRPKVVIETGVANGFSSAYILSALEDNKKGRLFSIDLHSRNGVTVPVGKSLGWVIPEELKHKWNLRLGESFKVLPHLLAKLGSVDMFFHDSRHTYRTMMKEFTIVWPYLREGSLLVSDDAMLNDALLDFCDRVGRTPVLTNGIGIVSK